MPLRDKSGNNYGEQIMQHLAVLEIFVTLAPKHVDDPEFQQRVGAHAVEAVKQLKTLGVEIGEAINAGTVREVSSEHAELLSILEINEETIKLLRERYSS